MSMIQRALSVCSTYSLLDIEFKEIRYYSHLNGYPRGFVDTLIGIGLTKYLNRNNNDTNLPVARCRSFIDRRTDRHDEEKNPTFNGINPTGS
jgi:hypothetical protein